MSSSPSNLEGGFSYNQAIEKVTQWIYENQINLSSKQIEITEQIIRRIQRLELDFKYLIDTNEKLMSKSGLQAHYNPVKDVNNVEDLISVKTKRADLDIPVFIKQVEVGSAYVECASSNDETPEVSEISELKFELESHLENYYYNAHRVLKLIKHLPGLKYFKCNEITFVRNQLIEHDELGQIYSFGYSAQGPVIRPNSRAFIDWVDGGFIPNTQSFVAAISSAFGSQVKKNIKRVVS